MTVYNFILAFLSAGCMFLALYLLFTVIVVHKKIFDKHFYFFIFCFLGSFYIFFEMLLSLQFTYEQYLLLHRLKLLSAMIVWPIIILILYESYFPDARKFIPYINLLLAPIFILSLPFDIFVSMPIRTIIVNTSLTKFIYHISTANEFYSIAKGVLLGNE